MVFASQKIVHKSIKSHATQAGLDLDCCKSVPLALLPLYFHAILSPVVVEVGVEKVSCQLSTSCMRAYAYICVVGSTPVECPLMAQACSRYALGGGGGLAAGALGTRGSVCTRCGWPAQHLQDGWTSQGSTVCHTSGHLEVVKELLARGASINSTKNVLQCCNFNFWQVPLLCIGDSSSSCGCVAAVWLVLPMCAASCFIPASRLATACRQVCPYSYLT